MGKNDDKKLKTDATCGWPQKLLLGAIFLNSFALLVSLYVTKLEDSFTDKREKEWYFITNQQAISSEIAKRTLLHTSLNQLKMLRRISKDRLTGVEYKSLLRDEEIFQRQIDSSLVKIVGAAYLQANDPQQGFDPDEYFSGFTAEELSKKLPEYEAGAFKYVKGLKTDMVALLDSISRWKMFYAMSIILSTILLLYATYLNFRRGRLNNDIG